MTICFFNRRSLACGVLALAIAGLPLAAQERHRARNRARGERDSLRTLANALVDSSLSLSKETDPVRKAKLFDQLAAALAERAKAQAGSGDEASAEKLTVCSSRLIEEGVVGNIEKAQFDDGDSRSESARALLDGVGRTLDDLQEVVGEMPKDRRARIVKCIDACRNRGQDAGKRLQRRVRHRHEDLLWTERERKADGESVEKARNQGPPPWAGRNDKDESGKLDRPRGEGAKRGRATEADRPMPPEKQRGVDGEDAEKRRGKGPPPWAGKRQEHGPKSADKQNAEGKGQGRGRGQKQRDNKEKGK